MIDRSRLIERMVTLDISQSELARRVGVSQATIGKLTQGKAAGSSHLHKIARELGTTPAYLTSETDDPQEGALPLPSAEVVAEQLDMVPIDEISLEYGMGARFLLEESSIDVVKRWFPRDWLRLFTESPPSLLSFARGRGDSMTPTLLDGDLVLIDRNDRHPREQDRVWAVAYGEFGAIKRLRSIGGGQFRVMSDNPNVRDEIVTGEELTIVGRVVWIGRKM